MASIIHLKNQAGEPRVDSREIAQNLGVKHKNTLELIERYADRFRQHGLLPFQTEAVKRPGSRGAKHLRYVSLNEDQCYFLLALSRNTPKVVELKSELVHAFGAGRRAGYVRQLSIMEKLARLDVIEQKSMGRASRGSHLMHDPRREIPVLAKLRDELQAELQPQLKLLVGGAK